MSEIILPPVRAVLDLHTASIERFGGSHGVRDAGGVEAALARAEQVMAYAEVVDVFSVAAAIGYSLCKIRHPFVDGNKRAAWFTMFVVLRMNGWYLDARETAATALVLGAADGSVNEDAVAAFLRDNSVRA